MRIKSGINSLKKTALIQIKNPPIGGFLLYKVLKKLPFVHFFRRSCSRVGDCLSRALRIKRRTIYTSRYVFAIWFALCHVVVKCTKIKIRHQVGLYIIHRFILRLDEFVDVEKVGRQLRDLKDVGLQSDEPLGDVGARAFDQRDDGHERADADNDAEHRQAGAQLVGEQGSDRVR